MISLRQLLADPAAAYPAHHIVAYRVVACANSAVTWGEICERVSSWELTLTSVNAGQIALYERDGVEVLAALLAIWRSHKQAMLPANNLPAAITQLCGYTNEFIGDFPALGSHGAGRVLVINGDTTNNLQTLEIASADTPALTLFTSGSSGAPEAVAKSFAQLESEIQALETCRGAQLAGACISGSVSHQHIYGLLFRLLWPLSTGRPFINIERDYWEELASDATQHHPLAIVTSPAHLHHLSPITFVRSPCAIFSSGAPLSAQASVAASEQLGCVVTEVYGSTETGGIAWREQTRSADWRCLPAVEVDIDEAGLLRVRSGHLPQSQWFTTADKAQLTNEGFRLLGRADRIAKVGGKRISLTAVEQLLGRHEFVQEVRVVPLPDRHDRLGAVVMLTVAGKDFLQTNGRHALNERLKAGMDQTLERIAIPRYWRYPEALPHNSQGKVTQAALQALFNDGAGLSLPLLIDRHQQGETLRLTFDIPDTLVYFHGHFPGNPVLPGIAQTHWAIHYAREFWGNLGEFVALEAVKFQHLILPRVRVILELEYIAAKGKVYFRYHGENAPQGDPKVFSSGRILFNSET